MILNFEFSVVSYSLCYQCDRTGAGVGPGFHGLSLGFGVGTGCGIGIGFGYGFGIGAAYDENGKLRMMKMGNIQTLAD
ncbi:hypothetical protein HU200_024482 [Digitaria exilis]|uniref:Uncharacterized protein n=1 Tax=Digitaria exilis TaxID=1010633 RepID=A0A835C4K9_9POAL|nr:hypothetical protein HU200_024482 [Digitaria exilis]